jgi:SAM-dependent methyltransferase
MSSFTDIERRVGDYYTDKLREHGATFAGVDWNSDESQQLRFDQLLQVVDLSSPLSVNDWGCGYGALLHRLRALDAPVRYCGYDVSDAMVAAAREKAPPGSDAVFTTSVAEVPVADYTVASGVFNVLAGADTAAWAQYVIATVRQMASHSRYGIAFNALTSYSDPDRMVPTLYYADPCALFDWCKRHLSRDVALLHDYRLYEFTLLVRLDESRLDT